MNLLPLSPSWFLVPKLRLGTIFAKLCFASTVRCPRGGRETEFRGKRSQTEFGNQGKQGIHESVIVFVPLRLPTRAGPSARDRNRDGSAVLRGIARRRHLAGPAL